MHWLYKLKNCCCKHFGYLFMFSTQSNNNFYFLVFFLNYFVYTESCLLSILFLLRSTCAPQRPCIVFASGFKNDGLLLSSNRPKKRMSWKKRRLSEVAWVAYSSFYTFIYFVCVVLRRLFELSTNILYVHNKLHFAYLALS